MYVDIDFGGRHLDKKEDDRKHRGRQNVAIGLEDGMLNEAVANQPSIDENEYRIAVQFLNLWLRDETMQPKLAKTPERRDRCQHGFIFISRRRLWNLRHVAPPGRGLRQPDTLQWFDGRERN